MHLSHLNKLLYVGILILVSSLFFSACSSDDLNEESPDFRGSLISSELLLSFSPGQVDSLMLALGVDAEVEYGVDYYKIVYETIDPFGEMTIASGGLAVPDADGLRLPLGSYLHGTILRDADAPSNYSYESPIGVIGAATGYIVALPDFLGLGESPGIHYYHHTKSTATASVDMLRASRAFLEGLDIEDNGELFLFGYSQGGHATMAVHKEIQELHQDEFSITGSAPMSGAYDLNGAQQEFVMSDQEYCCSIYLPYLLIGYNDIYNIYESTSDFLKEPYASEADLLADEIIDPFEYWSSLPSVPRDMIRDDVLEEYLNDENHPFRQLLKENSLIDWTPSAPMRIYYCTGDEQVYYENALVAYNSFLDRGASNVSLVNGELLNGGSQLNHGECAGVVLLLGLLWFDQL